MIGAEIHRSEGPPRLFLGGDKQHDFISMDSY